MPTDICGICSINDELVRSIHGGPFSHNFHPVCVAKYMFQQDPDFMGEVHCPICRRVLSYGEKIRIGLVSSSYAKVLPNDPDFSWQLKQHKILRPMTIVSAINCHLQKANLEPIKSLVSAHYEEIKTWKTALEAVAIFAVREKSFDLVDFLIEKRIKIQNFTDFLVMCINAKAPETVQFYLLTYMVEKPSLIPSRDELRLLESNPNAPEQFMKAILELQNARHNRLFMRDWAQIALRL